jgi:hypothetical protein
MVDVEVIFTVPPATDRFDSKILHTYVQGRFEAGDFRHEPRIMLAQYLYNNWTCEIPINQINFDQYFTGYGDIAIKFKENNATIVGGQTGRNDFVDAGYFLNVIPYHSRIEINIVARVNTPKTMPDEINTLKMYIEDFIKARPLGMQAEGIQELYLDDTGYSYPEQRDKNTFKTVVGVMMKYAKVYH